MNMRVALSVATAVLAALAISVPASAAIQSKSKELIVMQPHDLPEQAQMPGNSFFLYTEDDSFITYLYIEQQQGTRLSVFDVTDPGKTTFVSSTPITGSGAFDFVQPLHGHCELIRFRDNNSAAVLDLRKAKTPVLHSVSSLSTTGMTESLGESGFLVVNEPHEYIRAIPRDYQVVDSSSPLDPVVLATVPQVIHKLTNDDTGTTFLLGSDGLSLVRRTSVEKDNKARLRNKNSNQ